jgi:hypothetical protein
LGALLILVVGVGLGVATLRLRDFLVRWSEELTGSPPERRLFWYRLHTFLAMLGFVFGIVGAIIIQWG